MSKITLVTDQSDLTSFNADYFAPILNKYFTIVNYDSTVIYDRQSTVVVTGLSTQVKWYHQLEDEGFKILVDNLWELPVPQPSGRYMCYAKNWFWYNESIWYKFLGYNQYSPTRTYSKLAFMPMRRKKIHRTMLFDRMQPYINDMIFSYVGENYYLPNDLDKEDDNFQRYFNPEWYNDTYFSIVAESIVSHDNNGIFATEKTFKPLAFYHPMVVFGQSGVLKFIQDLGFETFENIFDESYDRITDVGQRLEVITNNVKNFVKEPYSKLTLDKLTHNHELFFNQSIVESKIVEEIINPILEYANK